MSLSDVLISDISCAVQVTAVDTGSVTAGRWSLELSGRPNCCRSFRGGWMMWASLDLFQSQMYLLKTLQPKKSRVNGFWMSTHFRSYRNCWRCCGWFISEHIWKEFYFNHSSLSKNFILMPKLLSSAQLQFLSLNTKIYVILKYQFLKKWLYLTWTCLVLFPVDRLLCVKLFVFKKMNWSYFMLCRWRIAV